MTLEQLRIFAMVAQTLSMTRAAERLHLSQPAVSAAIAALEQRHATHLFDRVGRRLELTEAGRLFLPEARTVLARADEACRVLDELGGLMRGEVRIAASQTVATYWLPRRMARFAATAPHVRLHLFVGNTAQSAARVLQGEADIGFVEGEVDEALLSRQVVDHDRIGLYAAHDHPLAGRPLTRVDLEAAQWVMREPGSGTRDHVTAGLVESGLAIEHLQILLELPSNGAALEAVEGSQLVTAVSELAAAARVGVGLIRPLEWPLPPREFTMLLHRARRPSRATAAFQASL
ncbi:LysR substrate-binding domain-containing protein [Novosphingobium album (ex Liu et al. 2023)]|uniref:LysR substrate-binding domain-containing protein n=1 Tax=Novosphingobium album (ex Liu et al. 2023) TaxID=3031130 RepID=A0ABT5WMF0_9SPHN|nr:LysR substrate-binding domain-containing protein [Novosphingobium album (ex Liu et al. 2023)]MDE8651212.1 LysR substrate-binding domain-containing protein [Novosphingobium album (ex Liu et al. 2023)]